MLKLIDYFLVKKYPEFVQLSLDDIKNNAVTIDFGNKKYYGSFVHLLYDPQIIGVQIPDTLRFSEVLETITHLSIDNKKNTLIDFQVKLHQIIKLDKETVLLFEVEKTQLHISLAEKRYVNRFYVRAIKKNNFVIKHFDTIVFDKILSFFYYPKPVYLISTASNEERNSFPVDTCHRIDNHFIFGVRASNKLMSQVAIDEIFCMSLSDFEHKEGLYNLGNYSPEKKEISYIENQEYGIKIPHIISKYQFVSLVKIHSYLNQNIYVAKVISEEFVVTKLPFLAHIHKFWLLPHHEKLHPNLNSV